MHSLLGFLGMVILLLAMVNHAQADEAREDAEGQRTEVVLEGSEIDSSTVEVGALAVIVYGQGKRQPVSGEWTKLDTARGYIQVLTAKSLILTMERDGWPESIALDRIQTLVLVESPFSDSTVRDGTQTNGVGNAMTNTGPSQGSADRDSTLIMGDLSHSLVPKDSTQAEAVEPDLAVGGGRSARTGRVATLGTGERIVLKFSTGTLAAYCSIHAGARLMGEPGELSGILGGILGAAVGYLGAVPAGVTLWDPYDDPDRLVLASFLGGLVNFALPRTPWVIYVSSPALATIASEWSRQPPKDTPDHRISVSLMPDDQEHLLVVTTVRF